MDETLVEQLNKAEKYLRKLKTKEGDEFASLVGKLIAGKAKATDKRQLQRAAQLIADKTNAVFGLRDAYERDMAHAKAIQDAIEEQGW